MATPQQFDTSGQLDRGNLWFHCLSGNSDVAKAAWAALNARNYAGKKDDKGKVLAVNHHDAGTALFARFVASEHARAGARPSRKKQVDASDLQTRALRTWVRDTHAELLGIKRNTTAGELSALPTLQELDTLGGLRTSATDMIAFLGNAAVQPILLAYNLSAADAKEGQALQTAWDQARGDANTERGGERGKTQQNMSDREAFVDWLGIWWAIAKVRLRTRPDVLDALGVELGTPRRRSTKSVASVTAVGEAVSA